MAPRSVASSPDLSIARKDSLPALNGQATSSDDFLSSPIQPGKMSVIQRARAFDQRAAAGHRPMTSPRPSPPPLSPLGKNVALGTRFAIPLSTLQRYPDVAGGSSDPVSEAKDGVRSEADKEENSDSNLTLFATSEVLAGSEQSEISAGDKGGTLEPEKEEETESETETEDGEEEEEEALIRNVVNICEEDHDETPRQSTNYTDSPKQISRQDSSRQANYSLKPMIYSPTLVPDSKPLESTAPPRLPMLFFEGQDSTKNGAHRPQDRSTQLRSPSLRNEPSTKGVSSVSQGTPEPCESEPEAGTDGALAPEDDIDASNQSFFWHSPHDSADETDGDEIIQAEIARKPINSSKKQNTLTSATALGFGGPSDWEHFYGGEYETTDLIDDTDLYLSKERREDHKMESLKQKAADASSSDVTRVCIDRDAKTNSHPEDQQIVTEIKAQSLPTIEESQELEESSIVTQHVSYNLDLDDFARSPPPTTPAASHTSIATPTSSILTENKKAIDSINLSFTSTASQKSVKSKSSSETVLPIPKDGHASQENSSGESSAKESISYTDGDATAATILPVSDQQPRTPPPVEIEMPHREIKSQSELVSGPSSPPVDDPNASEITISMVLPPDFDPMSPTMQNIYPPLRVADSRKSVFPQGEEQPNPYAGLNPMAKASLNRFIRMLREEEKTEADHDKYYVFVNFVRREMKLRATLYDMDEEPEFSLPPSVRASTMSSSRRKGRSPSTAGGRLSTDSPRSTAVVDSTIGKVRSILLPNVISEVERSQPISISQESSIEELQLSGKVSEGDGLSVEGTKDAGKPVAVPLQEYCENFPISKKTSLEALNKSIELVAPRTSIVTTALPPTALESSPEETLRDGQSAGDFQLPGAQILEHSLSVKSNEGRPYDGDKASNRQSIYRPFSGMLRSSSSHRRKSEDSVITVKSTDKSFERREGATSLLSASMDRPLPAPGSKTADSLEDAHQTGRQRNVLEPLLAIIPHTNVLHEEHRQLADLRFDMDNVKDDFSFIHKTVLAWDGGAKIKRERYEYERQQRMSENERRVDELFNDNEIGYGDIGHLEDEFKAAESTKKAEEEREEVESFVSSVFDVVWARINYEMDQLTPLYQDATKLVADASAGRQMFDDTDERVPIAPIMEILLVLYQKLMIRHQKAFEAVLERDRRLKKTEVSPWFGFGAIDKVKRIEKRFEDAEKKAILEFCRQRDERANQLMDVLDQHTLRGVGANQDYMESIMQAVRRISVHLAAKGNRSEDEQLQVSSNEVFKAKVITAALARSSEQIVRTFHVADMLLNAADYEVSVANAKLSNADATAFKRLRDAKSKEDAKLADDLEHRLGLIRSDTSRTQEEMSKLLTLLGSKASDLKFDITKERDRRMIAALNEARNKFEQPPPLPEK